IPSIGFPPIAFPFSSLLCLLPRGSRKKANRFLSTFQPKTIMKKLGFLLAFLFLLMRHDAVAQDTTSSRVLFRLSPRELSNVVVVSASKVEQKQSEAPNIISS